jgi:hypothetical protein
MPGLHAVHGWLRATTLLSGVPASSPCRLADVDLDGSKSHQVHLGRAGCRVGSPEVAAEPVRGKWPIAAAAAVGASC